MQKIEFYQTHLNQVSRSFAFCIQKLPTPFRLWTSISYLLCRILDTIEDAPWTTHDEREGHYQQFYEFLENSPAESAVLTWAKKFPKKISEGESLLLTSSVHIFNDMHELAPSIGLLIKNTVDQMYQGMTFYSQRSSPLGLKLIDLVDVNRYCYFVAGVVGELLSGLFVAYRANFEADQKFKTDSIHFGLFLQKVNLLKDQTQDETENRFLVPDRKQLILALRKNAHGALNYLLKIPSEETGYRLFCAWSLFLGGASLAWSESSYPNSKSIKIPRSLTQELLQQIEKIIHDNVALENAFRFYFPVSIDLDSSQGLSSKPKSAPTETLLQNSEWFYNLTSKKLGNLELAELEMN